MNKVFINFGVAFYLPLEENLKFTARQRHWKVQPEIEIFRMWTLKKIFGKFSEGINKGQNVLWKFIIRADGKSHWAQSGNRGICIWCSEAPRPITDSYKPTQTDFMLVMEYSSMVINLHRLDQYDVVNMARFRQAYVNSKAFI